MIPLSNDDMDKVRRQFDKEGDGGHNTKAEIISVACDKCLHQCFPVLTGLKTSFTKPHRSFRLPDDGEPFGFDYYGVTIEVHVETKRDVPCLTIYGIADTGKVHMIAHDIYPTERQQ